ncbi:MAG: NusG domain II-containing protein [Mariprofundaceae bacterium]|nr:NusG domain II-containing protein [Mariprofundaceae bacterium]
MRQRMLGTWTDRLLLVLVLGGIAFGWMHVRQLAGGGEAMVEIYRGQTLLAVYPLQSPAAVHFAAQGEVDISEVLIEHGEVAITDSPCTTKKCILSGHKHRIGDMLVCLPNRILVAIRGDAQAFDAMLE